MKNMYHPKTSDSNNNTTSTIPDEFVCPLTLSIMKDPVMVQSGKSFERRAIFEWLGRGNTTNPLTRQELQLHHLVTNHALQIKIQKWKQEQQSKQSQRDGIMNDETEVSMDDSEFIDSTINGNDDDDDDDDSNNDDDDSLWDTEEYQVLRTIGLFHRQSTTRDTGTADVQEQQQIQEVQVDRELLLQILRNMRQQDIQQQQQQQQQRRQRRRNSIRRRLRRVWKRIVRQISSNSTSTSTSSSTMVTGSTGTHHENYINNNNNSTNNNQSSNDNHYVSRPNNNSNSNGINTPTFHIDRVEL